MIKNKKSKLFGTSMLVAVFVLALVSCMMPFMQENSIVYAEESENIELANFYETEQIINELTEEQILQYEKYLIANFDGTMSLHIPDDVEYDQNVVNSINNNLLIMNNMVIDDIGKIDAEGEFLFNDEEEFATQWSLSLNVNWSRVLIKADKDFTILIGSLSTAYHFKYMVGDVKNIYKLLDKNKLATTMLTLIQYVPLSV